MCSGCFQAQVGGWRGGGKEGGVRQGINPSLPAGYLVNVSGHWFEWASIYCQTEKSQNGQKLLSARSYNVLYALGSSSE